LGERGDAGSPDQPVTRIGAFEDRSKSNGVGADRFDILHRMHRKIDLASQQLCIQRLGPQRLAADLCEGAVEHDVTLGRHRDDFNVGLGPAMRSDQRGFGHMRLRHRKRGGTGAEAERWACGGHGSAVLATVA
jgi:hypothetical protein